MYLITRLGWAVKPTGENQYAGFSGLYHHTGASSDLVDVSLENID
jgi:hypothetical protein